MANPATPSPTKRKPPYVLIGIFGALVIATAAVLFMVFTRVVQNQFGDTPSVVEYGEGGESILNPPRPLSDFTLTSHLGEPVSLSDLEGKLVLIAFGYTHCPDVCPLTLMDFARVNELLGEDADKVQFVFASVDGERDTPEHLARYFKTRKIDHFALGMTGTEAELRSIGADYGLYFAKNYDTGSGAHYLVDHTASTFLIDQENRLTTIFGFGTEPEVILQRMQSLLS